MAYDGAMRLQPMARTVVGDRGPSGAAKAPETLYNRWKRWSDKGIFARMMAGLAAEHGEKKTVMIPSRDIAAQCPAGQWTPPRSKHTAPRPAWASSKEDQELIWGINSPTNGGVVA